MNTEQGRGGRGTRGNGVSLFALAYNDAWLRSYICASDTQIRIARQKSTLKQEDPVWKFLWVNVHFIRTIWCSLPFSLVRERRPYTSFFSTPDYKGTIQQSSKPAT